MREDGPKRSRLRALADLLLGLLRRKPPQTPGDPYAYRMAPLKRGPSGRSGTAIADLEDDSYRAFPPRRQ